MLDPRRIRRNGGASSPKDHTATPKEIDNPINSWKMLVQSGSVGILASRLWIHSRGADRDGLECSTGESQGHSSVSPSLRYPALLLELPPVRHEGFHPALTRGSPARNAKFVALLEQWIPRTPIADPRAKINERGSFRHPDSKAGMGPFGDHTSPPQKTAAAYPSRSIFRMGRSEASGWHDQGQRQSGNGRCQSPLDSQHGPYPAPATQQIAHLGSR